MSEDMTRPNDTGSGLNAIKGKNEIPLDKRGYNEAPAVKIERPKPSPTPPPPKQD
jgi:hypothetical protein